MCANHYMEITSCNTLRSLMEMRSFSSERLARYAGCSKSFIVHLRVGRKKTCTPLLGERIAEALNVPTELIFIAKGSCASGTVVPLRRQQRHAA